MTDGMRRGLFWLLLSLVVALAGVAILKKHIGTSPTGEMTVRSDVLVYVDAAADLLAGRDLYHRPDRVDPYVYPPFFAVVNIPLVGMNPLLVDVLWYLLNVVLVGAIIFLSYHLFTGTSFARAQAREQWTCAGLGLLFASRYLIRNAQQGNVNVVLLFLILLSLYLISRTGKEHWAAILGVAAAIKVLPLAFFLYFAARRQWKCIGYGAAAFVGATFLPALVVGPAKNWEYLRSFIAVVDARLLPDGVRVENFAVWGTLGRLLSHQPAFFSESERPVYVNFLDLDLATIRLLVHGVNLVLLAICFFAVRRESRRPAQSVTVPRGGSIVLVLLFMHLSAILIEDHHTVAYLVAYIYVLLAWRRGTVRSPWFGRILLSSAIASCLLTFDVVVPLFGRQAYMMLLAYSLPTLAIGCILFVLVLSCLLQQPRRAPDAAGLTRGHEPVASAHPVQKHT